MKCPKCKKDDNVRKISVVLDEGTTTSQTLGFNVPINNHKKHQNDAFSVSTFSTTSQSVLVSRLQPPSKPTQKWAYLTKKNFLPYAIIPFVIFFLQAIPKIQSRIASNNLNYNEWSSEVVSSENSRYIMSNINSSLFGAIVLGGIVFCIVAFIKQQSVPPSEEQKKWQRNFLRYRSSFYCFRDDICFNEDLNEYPELFKSKLFE